MSKKRPLKILLVQVANMNLGDQVLADNDEYLLKKALFPRRFDILRYSISSGDVGQVRYADAVVFAGGILKVTNEHFWEWIPAIIREADRWQVPVFLSAIGCERFYPDDPRSVELKEALNLPVVKGISCRDDIETLRRDYIIDPGIRLTSVTDPAVWCRQTYRTALEEAGSDRRQDSGPVGLGVVREQLFADYGNPQMDGEGQLAFWEGVIRILEDKGLPWVLFTNGDSLDEKMAETLLARIGHGEKLPAPADGAALVAMISGFRGVIAGRMHSNIVAYALGIPSVGFVWNRKLRFWSEKIGYPERFLEIDEMDPGTAVSVLTDAMKQPCGPGRKLKWPVKKALLSFSWRYVRKRNVEKEKLDYRKHLVAAALGGISMRYRNTNAPEAFKYSLAQGYAAFQTDLRLTSDGVLVCVNRWHKDTYKILGLPLTDPEKDYQPPVPADVFLGAKYYNRFSTCTFDSLAAMFGEQKKRDAGRTLRLIIGVGRPSETDLPIMLKMIGQAMSDNGIDRSDVILRIERRKDLQTVKEAGSDIPLMYYIIPSGEEIEQGTVAEKCRKTVKWCKKEGIRYVCMNPDHYNAETAEIIKKEGLKVCLFSLVKTERIIDALKLGADMVASHYYTVEHLERLTY